MASDGGQARDGVQGGVGVTAGAGAVTRVRVGNLSLHEEILGNVVSHLVIIVEREAVEVITHVGGKLIRHEIVVDLFFYGRAIFTS